MLGIAPGKPPKHEPACTGQWELFDSIELVDHEIAKKLCDDCPVLDWCETELQRVSVARTHYGSGPEGTWAGRLIYPKHLDPAEKRRQAAVRKREREKLGIDGKKAPIPHGTVEGYKRHRVNHDSPCKACHDAMKFTDAEGLPHGEPRGYRRHIRRDETPCEACRVANTEYSRRLKKKAREHQKARRLRGEA